VGNGFAGCTVDGASGMFWSCCAFAGALVPAWFVFEPGAVCPYKNTNPKPRATQSTLNHQIRRNFALRLCNRSPRFYGVGCLGKLIWCI